MRVVVPTQAQVPVVWLTDDRRAPVGTGRMHALRHDHVESLATTRPPAADGGR